MKKLITARTCPYGLKCWAYIDMLGSDVERVNVSEGEVQEHRRYSSGDNRVPFLVLDDRDIYDSTMICDWLLLDFLQYREGAVRDDCLRDFNVYKKYEAMIARINQSFFHYAASFFSSLSHRDALYKEFDQLMVETEFYEERSSISYLIANLAGFLSRFKIFEAEFGAFITTHGLISWLEHVNGVIDLNEGEYREFGLYFNRFIRAKQ